MKYLKIIHIEHEEDFIVLLLIYSRVAPFLTSERNVLILSPV